MSTRGEGGAAHIWTLELRTRVLRQLTSGAGGNYRPAWSADGQWIAFSSDRETARPRAAFAVRQLTELYVMRADRSQMRRVTTGAGSAGSPSWSPDGRSLVFHDLSLDEVSNIVTANRRTSKTRLSVVDAASGERRLLVEADAEHFSPRWLRDGRVTFSTWGADAGIGFADGRRGARGVFQNASWSADGAAMVFHRDVDANWPPVQPWPSADRRFELVRTGIFPSFSRDGARITFNSGFAGIGHNTILQSDFDGAGRMSIFANADMSALAPALAPREDSIAFGYGRFFPQVAGRENVSSRLALLGADGALRMLTPEGGVDGFPNWSPDGREIVFRRAHPQGRGLAILTLATGEVRMLSAGAWRDNFPSWSPDGRAIVFASDRDGDWEIYTIAPDGADPRRLTRAPGNDAHPAWSRDGRWIAFATGRRGFKDEAVLHHYNPQGGGELAVMRADGLEATLLTDDPYEDATAAFRPRAAR